MLKKNFVSYIENSIRKNWQYPALANYKGESFTYAETGSNILRLHETYKKLGVQRGDKIALIGKSSARWSIVYLSAVSYGAVIVPILPDFKPDDLQHLVNHSDSVVLFCEEGIYNKFEENRMQNVLAAFSLETFATLHFSHNEFEDIYYKTSFPEVNKYNFFLPKVTNDELAVISYTSGTTGNVKGVMLPNNSLAANVKFAIENMPLNKGDKIVSFLPLAHAFGCAFEFLFPFSIGCHIIILNKMPSPNVILQAFNEVKPALILSIPLVIEKIYKNKILPLLQEPKIRTLTSIPIVKNFVYKKINKKLSEAFGGNFRVIIVGGASFSKDAEAFFKKIKFRITVGYGMTEFGPLITYSPWNEFKPGSAGKVIDTLEAKVLSDDPKNIPGEIYVRGEGAMIGYYKNEEITREVIDKEGWIHTGDLGTMDADGTIHIKGRSKTMLLGPSGQNIYPDEIEAVLNNMHGIGESLIIQRNDKLVALIYPDQEVMKNEYLNEEEMNALFKKNIEALNHRMPKFMNVSGFEIQKEEFIKTPKKSIKRFLYS